MAIRKVSLANVDLNLLVALEALLLEQHVTRAARRLGMSQPAVSRSLTRLREIFDDALLVRVGQRMQRTTRAELLLPRLRSLLADVHGLLASDAFVPEHAEGVIRLALPDILVHMLVPPLLRKLAQAAPRLDVEVVQWSDDFRRQLTNGNVDLTIGQPTGLDRGLYAHPLVRNHWTTVVRRGHPILRKRWTLDTFCELNHLLIGFSSHGGGQVDAALQAVGKRRRIALRMPYATLSPAIVAESDLALTTARWLAGRLAHPLGLILKPLPRGLGLPPVDLPLVWHERAHRDPQQRWLRSTLIEVARSGGMGP